MISVSPSKINVATEPFRRERAQNAVLAGAGAALVVTFIMLLSLILHGRAQAGDLRRTIAGQRLELAQLQRSESQYSTILAKPGNADVFAQSVLLNELIARRSVSWTRVFEDLGTVLPAEMRLLSLRLPQVAAEGGTGRNRVQLDMWVGTEKPGTVIGLLKRLRASPLFGDAVVSTQSPPTQNDPLYKYKLTVAYAQQL